MAQLNNNKPVEIKKEELLDALSKCFNNVTQACEMTNINRTSYYEYYNTDPIFAKQVDELDNKTIDFAEHALLKKIKEGSSSDIQFFLKHKAKKRGYQEKTELDINIFQVKPPKKKDE